MITTTIIICIVVPIVLLSFGLAKAAANRDDAAQRALCPDCEFAKKYGRCDLYPCAEIKEKRKNQ